MPAGGVGPARCGGSWPSMQSARGAGVDELDELGGVAHQHRVALHHAGRDREGPAGAAEVARGEGVGALTGAAGRAVIPDTQLRVVVVAARRHREGVAMVGAQRVAGRRDRDALDALVDRELAEEPAAGLVVVEHHRVAVVVDLAEAAEARPEAVAGERAGDQGAGDVEDAPDRVDVLDVDAVAVYRPGRCRRWCPAARRRSRRC